MKGSFRLLALGIVLSLSAAAQNRPPVILLPPPPAGGAILKPMRLTRMETLVQVHGQVADTSVTMTFANPNDRVLSGDLHFPLPEGATVSGYALDVEGQLIDGVVVGKDEGRQVYEKIVRQGVDPGLVEWTKGNVFKTRVFPLPPRGTRTIRVRYVADLADERGTALYQLPLAHREPLDSFQLRIEVIKPGAPPTVRGGGLANFEFAAWRDSYVAETKLERAALTNDLIIALPAAPARDVAVEKSADGQTYFALHDRPAIPAAESPRPRRVVVVWDASGSRAQADRREREIGLLQAYLARLDRPALTLRVFRHAAAPDHTFERLEDLVAALRALDYDGGSQPAAAAPRSAGEADQYLLFSDGLGNFGDEKWPDFDRPVQVFSADAAAEHAALRALAERTGGQYFNLGRHADAEVLAALERPVYRFLRARFNESEVAAVHPAGARPVAGSFTLSGKLLGERATVTLEYGTGERVHATRTFTIERKQAVVAELLRIGWAQRKLEELLADPEANEAEIAALGRTHGLVTPGTSLIVLDRVEQYVEHRIVPPASRPDWQHRYAALVAEEDKKSRVSQESKIERVLKMWNERVAWWEKTFEYPKNFKFRPPKPARGEGGGVASLGAVVDAVGAAADADYSMTVAEPALAVPPASPVPVAERPAAMRALTAAGVPAGGGRARPQEEATDRKAAITIKAWDPKTPYLAKLKAAKKDAQWPVYLQQKKEYGQSPAFFLDCAHFFLETKQRERGLQVLSNVAELGLENAALLRVLGHRLAALDELDLAVAAFAAARRMRMEEPQSHRDLALVLARRAERALAAGKVEEACRADFRRAGELLQQVVLNEWDRFQEIELTALLELNRLLPLAARAGVTDLRVDPRLVKPLELDVRIVLSWDADSTDMDLWVTEPSGEKAMYNHPLTTIGGKMSRDFTDGYGPEEYLLRRALAGVYRIEANYYGSRSADLQGAVTLQAEVFTHYGTPREQRQVLTLRLTQPRDVVKVGEIRY